MIRVYFFVAVHIIRAHSHIKYAMVSTIPFHHFCVIITIKDERSVLMKKIFLFMLFALVLCSQCLIPNSTLAATRCDVKFSSEPASVAMYGLTIKPVSPYKGENLYRGYPTAQLVGANVAGLTLLITNNTNEMAVIEWGKSSIDFDGKPCGVPFMMDMKYKDAGKPEATPSIPLRPGASQEFTAFYPNVEFIRSWNLGGYLPKADGSIIGMNIAVRVGQGNTVYIPVDSPKVVLQLQ